VVTNDDGLLGLGNSNTQPALYVQR
jgi:hypothetical protein